MKLLQSDHFEKPYDIARETTVVIGNFDGVHIAHQKLIGKAREFAQMTGLDLLILTFRPHTAHLFDRFGSPHLIMSYDEKIKELTDLGPDIILEQRFNTEFASLSDGDFLYKYLPGLKAKAIFVGFDFSFGRGGRSGAEELLEYGRKSGSFIEIMSPVILNGAIVSSTRIRSLLMEGNIQIANELLGRRYYITGNVEKGKMLGKSIQIPTANISLVDRLTPREGVYLTITTIGGKKYRSISNVGKTSLKRDITVLETHILNFDKELYGEKIKVEFAKFLRPGLRFGSIEEMIRTIRNDIEIAKRGFENLNGDI